MSKAHKPVVVVPNALASRRVGAGNDGSGRSACNSARRTARRATFARLSVRLSLHCMLLSASLCLSSAAPVPL